MVQCFNHLSKTPFSQNSINFKSVEQVIPLLYNKVAFLIIQVVALGRLLGTKVNLAFKVFKLRLFKLRKSWPIVLDEVLGRARKG